MILSVLSLVLFGQTLALSDQCREGICNLIDCPPPERLRESCSNGRIQQHGSRCGCCDACIIELGVDEPCGEGVPLPGEYVAEVECTEGLFCNNREICQKSCSTVNQEVQDMLNSHNGQYLVGYSAYRCSDDGLYGPVQCSGSMCFCTDTDGNRLYSPYGGLYETERWDLGSMNCECARVEATAAPGQHTRECTSNGNYVLPISNARTW